jgi:hypothetical protein
MKDREDKASSHELISFMPYQPFSWDESNAIEDVHYTMFSTVSSSFMICRESFCSSSPIPDIVDTSGSHHCCENISHTMVDVILCISFVSTNLSQVNGYLKCESIEVFQDNEALQSTPMVMLGPHSFGLSSRINNFVSMEIISPSTLYTNSMHDSHLVC